MKQSFFVVLMALLPFTGAIHSIAQNNKNMRTVELWPNGAPNSNGWTEGDDTLNARSYSHITRAFLTIYPASRSNGIAIVDCPGGGYSHLAMQHEGHQLADWFNAQGITYAVLRYRMPNGHNDVPLSDVREALRYLRKNASNFNIDIKKVGVMGFSAGGHLASTAATHLFDDDAPSFQILMYPVISMNLDLTHKGSVKNLLGDKPSSELINSFSNEKQVTSSTPKAFIALSSDDKTVPPSTNGIAYYDALISNSVSATLHCYPSGGHGWGFRDNFSFKREWTGELEKWLRTIK